MKRVEVIWSSPNKDGLTASAKNQFVAGLSGAGAGSYGDTFKQKKWSTAEPAAPAEELLSA